MADRSAELEKIYDDSGAPGEDAFRRLVVKRGLKLTDAEARASSRASREAKSSRAG